MIVAGVMSGTSADGINVALVRMNDRVRSRRLSAKNSARAPRFELLGHSEFACPRPVRAKLLELMNASNASVAELARLNSLLGELYADAVLKTQQRFPCEIGLIGCHGQTLYHQGEAQFFLGRKVATTWQTGEGAIIAARTSVPVVSDFRPADMAAGGKGAPLVPFLDFTLFRDHRIGRIVQNIGGIANLTAIPAGASANDVIAFDTGPGNMVIDAVMQESFGRPFDRDGKLAASGTILAEPLSRLLKNKFFRAIPPKTAGREQFGREFVREFLRLLGSAKKEDAVATATALTAHSIANAVERFVPRKQHKFKEVILSGGGAKNPTLVAMLRAQLQSLGIVLKFSDDYGLPSEAKEAAAFALLAYQTWHRRPSNIPSATGAHRPAILGKISYP